jgi:hypothetical protein
LHRWVIIRAYSHFLFITLAGIENLVNAVNGFLPYLVHYTLAVMYGIGTALDTAVTFILIIIIVMFTAGRNTHDLETYQAKQYNYKYTY